MEKFTHRPSEKSFIYGLHPVLEAIKSGKEFDKILLQRGVTSNLFKEIFNAIREQEIHYQFVPEQKLNSLTTKAHQGIIAFTSLVSYVSIDEIIAKCFEEGKNPFILILDKVTDVRNMGAIARTAECAGIDALVFPLQNSAQINADAIKSSAGALLSLPLCRSTDLKSTIKDIKLSGLQIIAATEKASKKYFEISYNQPTAIIMGSEELGVSPEYLKLCDQEVAIPMLGTIGSLNVSAATSVILFEAVRQKINNL
jgi:23S rRNA (guanosine2251-2'-O)-methyltransferase